MTQPIDYNSADWRDGFQTASAENCFNERQRIKELEAENERLREALEQIASGRYRATGGLTPEILARAALSPSTDSEGK